MKIKLPELIENGDGTVRVQSRIETREGERVLWYQLDAAYKDYLVLDRVDAFVVGLIVFAMQINEEIVVDGPISNKLARNLTYYMHIMNMFYPYLHVIPLHFSKRDPLLKCPKGPGVGASFTAGVDSFCTLWDNFKKSEGDGNRITHLFNVYVGQRTCGGVDGRTLLKRNRGTVEETAKRLNLELMVMDSNLDDYYKTRFSRRNGPTIASCVLLLQKLFSVYYIPSALKYSDFVPEGSTPLADHLLSTEVLDFVFDGAQYGRLEKTKIISEWDVTHSLLTVCNYKFWEDRINCSVCEKCVRTMVTLDMLGHREHFKHAFDFTDFETKRDIWICNIFFSSFGGMWKLDYLPFFKEVKHYAKQVGYPLKLKPGKLLLALWLKIRSKPSERIIRFLKPREI